VGREQGEYRRSPSAGCRRDSASSSMMVSGRRTHRLSGLQRIRPATVDPQLTPMQDAVSARRRPRTRRPGQRPPPRRRRAPPPRGRRRAANDLALLHRSADLRHRAVAGHHLAAAVAAFRLPPRSSPRSRRRRSRSTALYPGPPPATPRPSPHPSSSRSTASRA
jgi:hypothetical protein